MTAKLQSMEDSGWLDDGTRVVVLDANFYNPTNDMVTASRFAIEILPQGYISSYYYSYTWPRSPHDMTDTTILLRSGLEVYITLFIIWLFIIEIKEFIEEGAAKYLHCLIQSSLLRLWRWLGYSCLNCTSKLYGLRQM